MIKKILSTKERTKSKAVDTIVGTIEKAKKKKVAPSKRTTKSIARQKIVWKVFDTNYKEVACFLYLEKAKAYLQADALTKKKNKYHFVNEVKVPMPST